MNRRTDKQKLFVGVDIAKLTHVVRCIDLFSAEHNKRCTFTQNKSGFADFFSWLLSLGDKSSIVIGMEATGHYWCLLYNALAADGWTVEVMNPILTSQASRRNIRGCKSDASDAKVIAKCVRDADYVPTSVASTELCDLQAITRARADLIKQRTSIKIHINTCLDIVFPEWNEVIKDCQSLSFIALLQVAPSAVQIARMDLADICLLLTKRSRGNWGMKKSREIHACAQRSLAVSNSMNESVLQMHLTNLTNTQALCNAIEKQMNEQRAAVTSPLDDIPYAGDVSHAIIIAEYGDVGRFTQPVLNNAGEMRSNPGQMLAFAGLDPRIKQSGKWCGTIRMTKRGCGALRSALLRTADTARKSHPFFEAIFNKHKLLGKAHYVCLSHVARKYIHALFWMVKYGDTFDWDIYTKTGPQKKAAA